MRGLMPDEISGAWDHSFKASMRHDKLRGAKQCSEIIGTPRLCRTRVRVQCMPVLVYITYLIWNTTGGPSECTLTRQ